MRNATSAEYKSNRKHDFWISFNPRPPTVKSFLATESLVEFFLWTLAAFEATCQTYSTFHKELSDHVSSIDTPSNKTEIKKLRLCNHPSNLDYLLQPTFSPINGHAVDYASRIIEEKSHSLSKKLDSKKRRMAVVEVMGVWGEIFDCQLSVGESEGFWKEASSSKLKLLSSIDVLGTLPLHEAMHKFISHGSCFIHCCTKRQIEERKNL